MSSLIIVHPQFEAIWPFVADNLHALWQAQGPSVRLRLADGDRRALGQLVANPAGVTRLITLGVPVTAECLAAFVELREAAFQDAYDRSADHTALLAARGVRVYSQPSQGFWGQSVAEFGLALTLCGLRRIPQLHHEILSSQTPWNYSPPNQQGRPSARGAQYGDDSRFTNGTVAGKRVRIVGAAATPASRICLARMWRPGIHSRASRAFIALAVARNGISTGWCVMPRFSRRCYR